MFYLSIASLVVFLAKIAYDLYQQLHKPPPVQSPAVDFTISEIFSMSLQVGKKSTYKITPRDANGNPVDKFADGTPAPTWPTVPPFTDAVTSVAPGGMTIDDTPVTTNPETLTASVVINGTAVQRSITGIPLAGEAVDFTIDEVVAP